jgi:outer membrane protein assembly factor BamB
LRSKLILGLILSVFALTLPGDRTAAQQWAVQRGQFRVLRGMQQNAERGQPTEGVFLPVDRETALRLERAKDMLGKGQAADAVIELDRILEGREDFFFKPTANETVLRSLKTEAQRLLGQLDKDQREIYELQFGTNARQLLDTATRLGDVGQLTEVLRRYFHTKAGYEAAIVLARHHLDHDRPLAAALVLARLKQSPAAAEQFEPNLSLWLAASWLRAEMHDKSKAVLADIRRTHPEARLDVAGKSYRVGNDDTTNLRSLSSLVGEARHGVATELSSWAMAGGTPARSAAMSGGSPLLNERWSANVFYSKSLKDEMVKLRKQFMDSGRSVIPSAQPLAVGNLVLMRTPHVVYGVDFESGKLLWPWPPQPMADEQVNAGRDPSYMHLVSERIWENNTTGAMSSDGELVFLIHDGDVQQAMGGLAQARFRRAVINPQGQMTQGFGPAMHNALSAHSLRREGALAWHVGGLESEMEPELAGAFFLGPPLPLAGQLYVLAEIKGGISLVVLDAKTGKLEWSQQLAMVEQNVQQDPYRRVSGVSPSFADGVLVCPTAAGAVVAVDLSTRSLLWGYPIPRTREQERMQQQRMNMGWNLNGTVAMPIDPGSRWVDNNAVIADGRVFVPAAESDQLHALNLLDGTLLWSPKRRENALYIGAVTDNRVILVGEQQVEAIDATNRESQWVAPLGSSRPSGRGFYSGKYYYLPLSSAEVIKIDLVTGEIRARARSRTGTIPGNLICYNGFVISQGVDSLEKYFQLEPLRKQVDKMLAANPDDPEALAWRGEIALDDGKIKEAVADLQKSFSSRPAADADPDYLSRLKGERLRTRGLLIDALTASLQADFAANKDSLAQLESLIETDSERAGYLRVLAAGQQREGKTTEALATYLKLADLKSGASELEAVGIGLEVRRDRWIGARLADLWSSTPDKDRATIEEAVVARLNAADGDNSAANDGETRADRLRQFIATFDFHPLADVAREKLLPELGESDSALEREQLLSRLAKSPDRARAGGAIARLASLYEGAGRVREAASFYGRLESEFGNVVCLDGKTGQELVAALPADYAVRRAMAARNTWPVGVVKPETEGRGSNRNQGYQQFWTVELRGEAGPFFDGCHVQYDQSTMQLVGRDRLGGEWFRVQRTELGQFNNYNYGYNTNYGVVDGHLLVVNTGFQVLAINTLRGGSGAKRVLWSQNVIDPVQFQMQSMMGLGGVNPREITNPWGMSRNIITSFGDQPIGTISPVIDGGIAILRGRELVFVDALSGKPLWVRHGVSPGSEIYGDGEVLIVAPADRRSGRSRSGRSRSSGNVTALVLRTQDGELLGERPAPSLEMRWATFGRNVLTWKVQPRSMQLILKDVWSDKELDLGTYPEGSKGTVVGGDSVAIYDASGKFVVRSLVDGRVLMEAAVEPDNQLHNIIVQRSDEQYLLISNRPRMIKASSRRDNPQPAIHDPNGGRRYNNGLVCGRIYAFDRTTGANQWQTPAIIDMHGYVAGQGSELPVLVFVRHVYEQNSQMKVSILCLDKRTGRAVYEEDGITGQAQGFEASADLEDRSVALQLVGQTRVLKFTDEPTPPEPPYQARTETPSAPKLSESNVGRIFRLLGDVAEQLEDAGKKKNQPQKAPPQPLPAPDPFGAKR